MRDYLDVSTTTLLMPPILGKIYMKYNPRSRQALTTIHQFCEQKLDELKDDMFDSTSKSTSSSIITFLYESLQEDEKVEAAKSEEKQKGIVTNGENFLFQNRNTEIYFEHTNLCWSNAFFKEGKNTKLIASCSLFSLRQRQFEVGLLNDIDKSAA